MIWEITILILIFLQYFLNKDLSLTTGKKCLKFDMCVLHYDSEGHVSQIFYIRPSFDFMEKCVGKFTKKFLCVIIQVPSALKVRLWVLRRDQTWIYVSVDISLITKHIFNNNISFKS